MSAIDQRFAELKQSGRKAFIPFITAGDPSMAMTCRLLERLDQAGSAIAKLASRIVIRSPMASDSSFLYASSQAGIKLDGIFDGIRSVKPKLSMPLVTMVSYAIIYRRGLDKFWTMPKQLALRVRLCPICWVEEAAAVQRACAQRDFNLIR